MDTKAIITAAACEIFRKYPLEKVTTEKIIQRAKVSRTTFYRYFRDKFDVLEQYCTEVVLAGVKDRVIGDHRTGLYSIHKVVYENRDMFNILFRYDERHVLEKRIEENNYQTMIDYYRTTFPQMDPLQMEANARFLAYGVAALIRDWATGELGLSLEEFADCTAAIFNYLEPRE